MVTGDHAVTARKIAEILGIIEPEGGILVEGRDLKPLSQIHKDERDRLLSAKIFARVTPAQKLDLVTLYQSAGDVVAMTGDGVNDAPALQKADIGVAMGLRGTEVAREAAAIVLRDDAFGSIVAAIREGRVIFNNIRRFLVYLLSCNISEVMIVALAVLTGLPLPILPLQILFLNLVTDVFPAFALATGEGEEDVLRRPPRDPREPLLGRPQWLFIVGRLIVTQPPRSLKSICASVGFVAWSMGHDPSKRFACVSYSQELAATFARQFRTVVISDWYRELFPNRTFLQGYRDRMRHHQRWRPLHGACRRLLHWPRRRRHHHR